ncbi:YhgE/Pip domain-containing protein [Cellulomonas fengjieae]|uniref:YhgE/Pip domain-containing protein n=1 Tax=Cellulomonas fengjieae TaxID=2819978 RepID=UPI001AAE4AB4|nr:YhgE/Pip domain-containing protein [Cellulomonas fengjieae]MBO3103661.1 YhgE/Pip domain-containing protein [Cellulomonas fengjieae]
MIFSLAWSELRRYRRPLERVALLFLVLLPSLYGGLYLWSNWDPYGHLEDIKVAVVDEDQAVTVQGKDVRAGSQVVEELQQDPIVEWTPTSATNAAAGLSDGTYLMTITIPNDFSANLASVQSGDPKVAEVLLRRDGANGFIVSVASRGLAIELEERINAAATAAYFTVLFEGLDELRSGLQQAADGAGRLRDGLTTAHDGTVTLAGGLASAQQASVALRDGAEQVAQGDQRIANVVNPLVDEVVPALPGVASAAQTVADKAAQLAGQVAQDADGLPSRTGQLLDELQQWGNSSGAASDPGFQQVVARAEAAHARAGDVTRTAAEVSTAANRVAARAAQVNADVPVIQARIRAAQSDIDRLASGSQEVATGLGELSTGLQSATDGANQLVSGTAELESGASTLTDGLTSAVQQIPTIGENDPEGVARELASPTKVTDSAVNDARYYGEGLAPFFFGIALCVFGVAAFTVLRPVNPRGLMSRAHSVRVALAGYLPVASIGVTGGFVLTAILHFGLGMEPRSWPATLGLVAVGSMAFTAIAHALRAAFGVVGSSIALVLLMLQLTSCAGIYPMQTLPGPLRAIHPLLPMSYVVDGLRIALTGGPSDRYVRDILVVGAWGLTGLLLGVAAVVWRRRWTITQVKPVLGE